MSWYRMCSVSANVILVWMGLGQPGSTGKLIAPSIMYVAGLT